VDIHHHGKVIKVYRENKGITQAELAEKWPKASGEVGVSTNYVQLVEAGKKHIAEQYTLRKLADFLEIPHWEFGLSEYDPFNPRALPGYGTRIFHETLNVTEALIQQTLSMRRIAPLPEVEKSAQSLHNLFTYFLTYNPPPSQLEPRFLSLYAQEQSIYGLMFFENKHYNQALKTFSNMYDIAKQLGDPVLMVHALQKMGVELRRGNHNQDAVNALEEARDISFNASKHVAAFANAYLAHIYAASGDALRFERAIHTAQSLADPIKESYGNGTDFVFQKMSGILLLRSRGYLRIHKPEKTLAFHEELKKQVDKDDNLWLDFRLHLYRARAYLMLDEIEGCIEAGRDFFRDVIDWQSPHRLARGYELLEEIERAGYGNLQVVRDFKIDLMQATQKK
jgi:transcriptional regulator with XRE-family HTH domain